MDNTTTKEQIDQFNDILHAQGDDEDVGLSLLLFICS